MAKVQLRDVRKSYGSLEVIHGVAMDVAGHVTQIERRDSDLNRARE